MPSGHVRTPEYLWIGLGLSAALNRKLVADLDENPFKRQMCLLSGTVEFQLRHHVGNNLRVARVR